MTTNLSTTGAAHSSAGTASRVLDLLVSPAVLGQDDLRGGQQGQRRHERADPERAHGDPLPSVREDAVRERRQHEEEPAVPDASAVRSDGVEETKPSASITPGLVCRRTS